MARRARRFRTSKIGRLASAELISFGRERRLASEGAFTAEDAEDAEDN